MASRQFPTLTLLALFVALPPAALPSTTWYVNGANGNDGNTCASAQTACKTITHTISLASSGDSIMVAPAVYTENLIISFSLNVIGSGASTTIIDGGGTGRVVTIPNSGIFTLSHVTIRNGLATYGGGIYNNGLLTISDSTVTGNRVFTTGFSGYGGGIYNDSKGTLNINTSTVSGNSAFARYGAWGGGINNLGNVMINNSGLNGNSTGCGSLPCPSGGGAINNGNAATINNSTLSGNSSLGHYTRSILGGAILNSGRLSINSSTVSGNRAFQGGGIYGSAVLQNSIIVNNSAVVGGNCDGTMTSNGYNLSSDGNCNFNNKGDLNNHDPMLGPLQNNGGPTQTMALLPGSPAIDGGNPAGCTDGQGNLLKTDQRGMPRRDPEDTTGCDMGAYERQSD